MDKHTFETVTMLMARPLEYGDTLELVNLPSVRIVILVAHSVVSPFLLPAFSLSVVQSLSSFVPLSFSLRPTPM